MNMIKSYPLFILSIIFSLNVYSTNLSEELLTISIPLISGENINLAKYEGKKPVYIKFWATWCQPCLKEMPHFEAVQQKYGDSVEVIGINIGVNDDLQSVNATIKKFGLTMPMAIDSRGDLAQAFRFIGTPYHLLFDRNMNLIHRGHKVSESLDNKIALISQAKIVNILDADSLVESEAELKLDLNNGKLHALFFTATWCGWYLKESRPQFSKNCIIAQDTINHLSNKYPDTIWHGLFSRLWTGEKDLTDYQKKYAITHPIAIDKSNKLFHEYAVHDLPTLVLIKDNKVVLSVTDFTNDTKVDIEKTLTKYINTAKEQ